MSTEKKHGIFALGDSVSYQFRYKTLLVGVVVEVLQKTCKLETPIGKKEVKKNGLYHWDKTAFNFWNKADFKIIQSKTQVQ